MKLKESWRIKDNGGSLKGLGRSRRIWKGPWHCGRFHDRLIKEGSIRVLVVPWQSFSIHEGHKSCDGCSGSGSSGMFRRVWLGLGKSDQGFQDCVLTVNIVKGSKDVMEVIIVLTNQYCSYWHGFQECHKAIASVLLCRRIYWSTVKSVNPQKYWLDAV